MDREEVGGRFEEVSSVSEVPVGGVEGLEKVSSVGGESVPVERVSVVDGVSLVEGMLVRGGAPVGAVEVVVLLSERQVKI